MGGGISTSNAGMTMGQMGQMAAMMNMQPGGMPMGMGMGMGMPMGGMPMMNMELNLNKENNTEGAKSTGLAQSESHGKQEKTNKQSFPGMGGMGMGMPGMP